MRETKCIGYRNQCGFCDEMLSAATEEALKQAHIDHLTKHLLDYFEDECEAGRYERVERDGRTLYRESRR